MSYERKALGMSEVRAASGVPTGVPGSWYARQITPEGEVRHSSVPVSRNWSHTVGGGPLHKDARFWSQPIDTPTDYPERLTPLGTIDRPERRIYRSVHDATGSRYLAEVVNMSLGLTVPGMNRNAPLNFLYPLVPSVGVAILQLARGRGVKDAAAWGGGLYFGGSVAVSALFAFLMAGRD